MTNCTNCSAHIKNVVTIGGKPYGTTCAEAIIGNKLPLNFSGDADAYIAKKQVNDAKQRADFKQSLAVTKKGWNVNVMLTNAFKNAKNDWQRSFVASCAEQCAAVLLSTYLDGLTFDECRKAWRSGMGDFPLRDYDLNDRFARLSDKQRTIIDKIYND